MCRHAESHRRNGTKPCEKCFKPVQMKHMAAHLKTCNPEEPELCCHQCDFKTKNKNNFKIHEKSHQNEEKHVCTICDFKAKSHSRLQSHIRKQHTAYEKRVSNV